MLEPLLPVRAREALVCGMLQAGGVLLAFTAWANVGELSFTVRCLHREHIFLSTLGISAAIARNPSTLWLLLFVCGHVAPIVAMVVLRGTYKPIAIQATFTAWQVSLALAAWLVIISDFVRTKWGLNCL